MGRFRVVSSDPASRTVTVVHEGREHPVHLSAASLKFDSAQIMAALPVGRELLLSFSLLAVDEGHST